MSFLRLIPAALLLLSLMAVAASAQMPADRVGDLDRTLGQATDMHQAGDVLGAIDAYRLVLETTPDRADVRSNLGAAYVSMGRFDEAIEQYREAIRLEPDSPAYNHNLGLALYKTARTTDAIPQFRRVLTIEPSHRAALLLLADCLLQTGDEAGVVDALSPREALFVGDLAYAYLLGMALIRTGQHERGQVYVDRIFKSGESAEGHLLMGMAHFTAHDYKAALVELAKAVELNPDLPRVHSFYGRALLASGDAEGAARRFLQALEQNPNDFDANLQLGGLRQREQRFDDALTYLNRAAALRPNDLAARHAMAGVYLAQGQADKALPLLETVVRDAPEYADAHVLLATTYYRLRRREDGDRERQIAARLTAEQQARQPAARQVPPASTTTAKPQGPTDQRR